MSRTRISSNPISLRSISQNSNKENIASRLNLNPQSSTNPQKNAKTNILQTRFNQKNQNPRKIQSARSITPVGQPYHSQRPNKLVLTGAPVRKSAEIQREKIQKIKGNFGVKKRVVKIDSWRDGNITGEYYLKGGRRYVGRRESGGRGALRSLRQQESVSSVSGASGRSGSYGQSYQSVKSGLSVRSGVGLRGSRRLVNSKAYGEMSECLGEKRMNSSSQSLRRRGGGLRSGREGAGESGVRGSRESSLQRKIESVHQNLQAIHDLQQNIQIVQRALDSRTNSVNMSKGSLRNQQKSQKFENSLKQNSVGQNCSGNLNNSKKSLNRYAVKREPYNEYQKQSEYHPNERYQKRPTLKYEKRSKSSGIYNIRQNPNFPHKSSKNTRGKSLGKKRNPLKHRFTYNHNKQPSQINQTLQTKKKEILRISSTNFQTKISRSNSQSSYKKFVEGCMNSLRTTNRITEESSLMRDSESYSSPIVRIKPVIRIDGSSKNSRYSESQNSEQIALNNMVNNFHGISKDLSSGQTDRFVDLAKRGTESNEASGSMKKGSSLRIVSPKNSSFSTKIGKKQIVKGNFGENNIRENFDEPNEIVKEGKKSLEEPESQLFAVPQHNKEIDFFKIEIENQSSSPKNFFENPKKQNFTKHKFSTKNLPSKNNEENEDEGEEEFSESTLTTNGLTSITEGITSISKLETKNDSFNYEIKEKEQSSDYDSDLQEKKQLLKDLEFNVRFNQTMKQKVSRSFGLPKTQIVAPWAKRSHKVHTNHTEVIPEEMTVRMSVNEEQKKFSKLEETPGSVVTTVENAEKDMISNARLRKYTHRRLLRRLPLTNAVISQKSLKLSLKNLLENTNLTKPKISYTQNPNIAASLPNFKDDRSSILLNCFCNSKAKVSTKRAIKIIGQRGYKPQNLSSFQTYTDESSSQYYTTSNSGNYQKPQKSNITGTNLTIRNMTDSNPETFIEAHHLKALKNNGDELFYELKNSNEKRKSRKHAKSFTNRDLALNLENCQDENIGPISNRLPKPKSFANEIIIEENYSIGKIQRNNEEGSGIESVSGRVPMSRIDSFGKPIAGASRQNRPSTFLISANETNSTTFYLDSSEESGDVRNGMAGSLISKKIESECISKEDLYEKSGRKSRLKQKNEYMLGERNNKKNVKEIEDNLKTKSQEEQGIGEKETMKLSGKSQLEEKLKNVFKFSVIETSSSKKTETQSRPILKEVVTPVVDLSKSDLRIHTETTKRIVFDESQTKNLISPENTQNLIFSSSFIPTPTQLKQGASKGMQEEFEKKSKSFIALKDQILGNRVMNPNTQSFASVEQTNHIHETATFNSPKTPKQSDFAEMHIEYVEENLDEIYKGKNENFEESGRMADMDESAQYSVGSGTYRHEQSWRVDEKKSKWKNGKKRQKSNKWKNRDKSKAGGIKKKNGAKKAEKWSGYHGESLNLFKRYKNVLDGKKLHKRKCEDILQKHRLDLGIRDDLRSRSYSLLMKYPKTLKTRK